MPDFSLKMHKIQFLGSLQCSPRPTIAGFGEREREEKGSIDKGREKEKGRKGQGRWEAEGEVIE